MIKLIQLFKAEKSNNNDFLQMLDDEHFMDNIFSSETLQNAIAEHASKLNIDSFKSPIMEKYSQGGLFEDDAILRRLTMDCVEYNSNYNQCLSVQKYFNLKNDIFSNGYLPRKTFTFNNRTFEVGQLVNVSDWNSSCNYEYAKITDRNKTGFILENEIRILYKNIKNIEVA